MNSNELLDFDMHRFLNYISQQDPLELLYTIVPPIAGMILAIILGGYLNKKVSNYINNHPVLQQVNLKTALIHGCKGLPLLFIVASYVYFVVKLLSLPAPVDHLLSYLLFTILAFIIF